MCISLNHRDKTPLYIQIKDEVILLIYTRYLQEGELLWSLNQLSDSLDISKITIKKAYYELKKLNIIETVPGVGSYIAMDAFNKSKNLLEKSLENEIQKLISESKNLSISQEDLVNRLNRSWN